MVAVGDKVRTLLPVGRSDLPAVDEEADEAPAQETVAAYLGAVSEVPHNVRDISALLSLTS